MKDSKTVPCSFRVPCEDMELLTLAAQIEGLTLSEFMRAVSLPAAHKAIAKKHAREIRDRSVASDGG